MMEGSFVTNIVKLGGHLTKEDILENRETCLMKILY